jgi:Ni,Fe-hydrogenase I small subunit
VIGQARREQIRHTHQPVGKGGVCAACTETYPCAAIQLLDEVEDVEKRARIALAGYRQERAHEITALRVQISELESRIDRARKDLS